MVAQFDAQDITAAATASLDPHCLDLVATTVASISNESSAMMTYFDDIHSQAVSVSNGSRLLVHVDVRTAAPNIIDSIGGGALCSVGNELWNSCGGLFFEQQIVSTVIQDRDYDTQVANW